MNQTKNTPLVISSCRAREKKVPLIGSSRSNIRNRTNQSPRRSGVHVRQTNNGCGQAYFFLPSPSPSPILNPSTSPLKSVFDSSQLSGSINVQDGGTTLFLKNNSWIALQNTPALQASSFLKHDFHWCCCPQMLRFVMLQLCQQHTWILTWHDLWQSNKLSISLSCVLS